jgi:translation elongation factor EF-1beta
VVNVRTEKQSDSSKWIIGILIGVIVELLLIIIFISSFKLSNDSNITNLISISSGLISIALAIVAIWITLKQEVNSNIINASTRGVLDKISDKINKIDTNVSSINMESIEKIIISMFDKLSEDISKKLEEDKANENPISFEKASELVKQSIDKTKEEAKDTLSSLNSSNSVAYTLKNMIEKFNSLTEEQKQLALENSTGIGYSLLIRDGKVSKKILDKNKSF